MPVLLFLGTCTLVTYPTNQQLSDSAVANWSLAVGPTGSLARWGGEEFVALVEVEQPEEGIPQLDALREHVPQNQTCSMGIAIWDHTEDAVTLLRRADEALYRAKESGRNRSMTADPASETTAETVIATPLSPH